MLPSCITFVEPGVRPRCSIRCLSIHSWTAGLGLWGAGGLGTRFCLYNNPPNCAGQSSRSQAALSYVTQTGTAARCGYGLCPRVSFSDLPRGCECGLYQECPVLAGKSAPGEMCPCLGSLEMTGEVLWPQVYGCRSGLQLCTAGTGRPAAEAAVRLAPRYSARGCYGE